MANKDYVRRGRSAKRTSTIKKQPPRRKPWRSALLALLLLVGFGYFLYQLNNDPKPPTTIVAQPPVADEPKPITNENELLPPPPQEQWNYVDTLPNQSIEVEAKKQVVSAIPYVMQCGAYKGQDQAEERKLKIAFQGLSSQIRHKEGSSWYRIILGPYKTKREAERDKHKLQLAKIEPCSIWKENQ